MKFKYNPWVSMVALLLLATILVLVCTGCAADTEEKEDASGRFTVEFSRNFNVSDQLYIITDTETGVQYLLADVYSGACLIKLED